MHSLPEKQIMVSMKKINVLCECLLSITKNVMKNINQEQFVMPTSLLECVANSMPFCQKTALLLYLSS